MSLSDISSSPGRGVSPALSAVIILAIVITLGAVFALVAFGLSGTSDDEELIMTLETEFDVRDSVEPRWVFEVKHSGGDPVDAGSLKIRFVDGVDGNSSEVRYPQQFGTGDSFRVELWEDTGRADTDGCLVAPEPAPETADQQLGGTTAGADSVDSVTVLVIHGPSNTVLTQETANLEQDSDWTAGAQRRYIYDGATPSVDCPDEPTP